MCLHERERENREIMRQQSEMKEEGDPGMEGIIWEHTEKRREKRQPVHLGTHDAIKIGRS